MAFSLTCDPGQGDRQIADRLCQSLRSELAARHAPDQTREKGPAYALTVTRSRPSMITARLHRVAGSAHSVSPEMAVSVSDRSSVPQAELARLATRLIGSLLPGP